MSLYWWGVVSGVMVFMAIRTMISHGMWEMIEPLLPAGDGRGRPSADHRQILEGIIWCYRTGSPRRDMPDEFGPWQTVWKRHFCYVTDGTAPRKRSWMP